MQLNYEKSFKNLGIFFPRKIHNNAEKNIIVGVLIILRSTALVGYLSLHLLIKEETSKLHFMSFYLHFRKHFPVQCSSL